MNKKGNVIYAIIIFVIVIILFGIFSMVGFNTFDDMQTDVLADLELNESKDIVNDMNDRYPSVFDSVILIVFVGLWIGGIVSVMVKEEHPIVFGLMMLLVVFTIIAGMFLANSYEEMMQDSDFSDLPASFPITHFIITHMMEMGIGMGVTILLAMYAKNKL